MQLDNLQTQTDLYANSLNIVSNLSNVADRYLESKVDKDIDKVEISSSLHPNITSLIQNIDQISTIQRTHKILQSQINVLDKVETIVEQQGGASEVAQSLLQDVATKFKFIYKDLNKLIEDQSSQESHTFFDGILGSAPEKEDLSNTLKSAKYYFNKLDNSLLAKEQNLVSKSKLLLKDEYKPIEKHNIEKNIYSNADTKLVAKYSIDSAKVQYSQLQMLF